MENKEKTDEFIEEKGVECNKCYLVRSDYSLYEDIGEWKKEYKEFLDLLNNGDETKTIKKHKGWVVVNNAGIGPYRDPDIEDSRSYELYEKLTKFLNIQENSLEYQLEGKYTYKFNYTKPYGIEVREKFNDPRDKNKEIESAPIFYLKSDQFGFSRPSTEHKHPYDSYLEKSSYSETSKEKVAEWLYNTRSLGGSFLWPMENDGKGGYIENPQYNSNRGGTKNSANYNTYYIEDRVDLTLYEIKQVMEYIGSDHPELQGNILWNCCLPETNMVRWLKHFKTFETYADFFEFNDFVDENLIPYDITVNEWKKEASKSERIINEESYNVTVKEYKEGKRRPRTIWTGKNEGMKVKELEEMFDNVADSIKKRSEAMEEIVRRSHMRKIKLYGDGTHDSLVATIYEDGKVESEEVLEVLTKEYGSIIDSAVRNFDDLYKTILEDDNLHYVPGFYFAHYETEEE